MAPLGNPVVPDVYWMLIGSSGFNSACSRVNLGAITGVTRDQQLVPLRSAEQHHLPSFGQLGRTWSIIAS